MAFHKEGLDDELTPLNRDNKDVNGQRAQDGANSRLFSVIVVVGVLIGGLIGTSIIIVSRRKHSYVPLQQQQQQVVVDPDPIAEKVADTEEIVYRPFCEYYTTSSGTKAPPRILQTSMYEPSQPWSYTACIKAPDQVVELNVGRAPDAILQTNFSISLPHEIMGFGGAFTEAAALNFHQLSDNGQKVVLELLFGRTGLGYAMGRVPINSCDFSIKSYNFDDVEDDFELKHFDTSLHHDVQNGMIDFITRAQEAYADAWDHSLNIFASPWSPPAWMKRPTDQDSSNAIHASKMTYSHEPNCLRGELGPENSKYARAWAKYFSKYIQAYKDHNVSFFAVSVQNEPEFNAPWEACAFTAVDMTDFVAYHLGPVLKQNHPNLTVLGFDHNTDHVDLWMNTMLNATKSSHIAAQYVGGTAFHWYAGGMDRLLDGAVGISNLHRLRENLQKLGLEDHLVLGSEACHCPTTGYAGGDIAIYWSRAERYAHAILADMAAGVQGWLEWNLILDSIGGPNHLGNLCETTLLAAPHRAVNNTEELPPLPDFEHDLPFGGKILGDTRTREELNALGFPAKYLDSGVVVQPIFYYMGHISRHVRPGSFAVSGLVQQSLGKGQIFRPVGSTVAGGGQNDLARNGIELLLWPCEGSTRQQFRWNADSVERISVLGHDWLGNKTESCIGREVDKSLKGMKLTPCSGKLAGQEPGSFDLLPIDDDEHGRYRIKLLNHPEKGDKFCLTILELRNGGGTYGPLGGAQLALGHCDEESAKWKLDFEAGTATSLYFGTDVCLTTGWPFLQMGAFRTPNGEALKTVVILNEAKDPANYALKDEDNILLTGSIPPRSIQTVLLDD